MSDLKTLNHGDILHIQGRGWYRAYTIGGFYKDSQESLKASQARWPDANFSKPAPWDLSLDTFKAHNREVGGKDFGLSEECVIIADDRLTMSERYAQRGKTVQEVAMGELVCLEGLNCRVSTDGYSGADLRIDEAV